MAEDTFRVLTTEIGCNTVANNFSTNTLIRIVNIDTAAHLCTLAFGSNSTTYATFTVRAGETIYVQKNYTDLLSSNATSNVFATPVRRGTV